MMKRLLPILFVLASVIGVVPTTWPSGAAPIIAKGSSSSSSGKTVHVKGYTKKDGTKVAPYDRKAPKSKDGSSSTATTTSTSTSSTTAATTTASATSTTGSHPADYCEKCARDSDGRILRGEAATAAFKKMTGYPKGRPGYVIDHVIPLACGGADDTSNMQWQTIAAGKAKDKTERVGCAK